MERSVLITAGLFVLSIVSGMLGLGVAFAAVPFLGLFMNDLVHEVQPLSLFLNGVTGLFSAFGFARSRLVAWREALSLALVTTLFAPLGSWMAQFTAQSWLWGLYLLAVLYLAWRMFQPEKGGSTAESDTVTPRRFSLALLLAIPISILAGLLGVGPGFLLMPTLIIFGFAPKRAAGINAVAVTPPSFSALVPHLSTMVIDMRLAAVLVVMGATGAFIGARLTSRFVSGPQLKRVFAVLIVVVTAYKLTTIMG
ncbi:sulfite exporter TauE/SafE family protein [Chloroflexus sp.]|uniref:sulfite exporter TauE/SafE family protein n=1 Tax=Chloroflexus sp. TaxID=1904827 RepID=UPI00404A4EA5